MCGVHSQLLLLVVFALQAPPAVAWGALDNAEAELDFDLLAAEFGGVTLQPAAPAEAAAAAEAAHSAGMEAPEVSGLLATWLPDECSSTTTEGLCLPAWIVSESRPAACA